MLHIEVDWEEALLRKVSVVFTDPFTVLMKTD